MPSRNRIDDLLAAMVEKGASDLHIVVGSPPFIRLHGILEPLASDAEKITPGAAEELITSIMTERERSALAEYREVDFAYSLPGLSRFRVNVCYQRDSLTAVMRAIPSNPPEIERLGFPPIVIEMSKKPHGLVLVTGPTGCGKSTTLAAMINYINRNEKLRIVTVEDPIEFLHQNQRSVITQREIGRDTLSFKNALRSALRQDPDVILVGEMRDLETIQLALTAAETGHLVFSTLHVTTAPDAVSRMVDVFPPEQQEQIRIQVSSLLEAVFTQTLLPRASGLGRLCVMEILIASPAVRNLIRENKPAQIVNAMQTGQNLGMQTLDRALSLLVMSGDVRLEDALEHSMHPEELRRLCSEPAAKPKFASTY
jgi:twitching motility protein PilT